MSKKLITKSAEILERKGFTQLTSTQDQQRDSGGITHIVVRHDHTEEVFLVRCKEYVYESLAPFGAGMVEHAIEGGKRMVIYFDDRTSFYVFDPHFVKEYGTVAQNHSKRPQSREWLEVSLDHGVGLDRYVTGNGEPDVPEGKRNNHSLSEWK